MDPVVKRFDEEWRYGDRDLAKKLAKEFIKARHAALAPALANLTVFDLVELIEFYRSEGDEENRIIADMWLLAASPRAVDGPIKITEGPDLRCEHEECVSLIANWIVESDKETAEQYCRDHPELAGHLGSRTLPELVGLVDFYREASQEVNRVITDMWLISNYEPQTIIGTMDINHIVAASFSHHDE